MENDNYSVIKDNIDFILSHFECQHELFPRIIMTLKTKGQKKIEYETDLQASKDAIFGYYKQANFIDCKINAFPFNTEHTRVNFDVKNKNIVRFIYDINFANWGRVFMRSLDRLW